MQYNYVSYIAPCNLGSTTPKKIQFDYEVIKTLNGYNLFEDRMSDLIPYTKSILDFLKSKLNFNTAEYVVYNPNTATNWETMPDVHYHIPVHSNTGSWILYENHSFQLPADGTIYIINVNKPHSIVNAGSEPVIHLVLRNQ